MPNATVRRRRLGAELRRLRDLCDLTLQEVADRMECSHAKLSRIELGRTGIRPKEVRELLDIYGQHDQERREYLLDLARPTKREKVWWTKYQGSLPAPYYTYIDLEAAANSIMVYEPSLVHGLLQTMEYARTTVAGGWKEISETEIQERVDARMLRQEHLKQRRDKEGLPRLWVILDESVLYRQIGGPVVCKAQLEHVLEAMADHKTTVQVMPMKTGAHPGIPGPFTLLGFEKDDPPAVYVETIAGDAYVEEESDIERCSITFEHLRAMALSSDDTERMIKQVIAKL